MKRILGMPETSPEPLGSLGSPEHAPGTTGDAPGTPGHAPGTPRDVPETPPERPWHPWGPPETSYGTQKRRYRNKFPAPEALNCCVRTCLLEPIA